MEKALVHLGGNIKRRRLQLGLSQEELADKCDFDRTYISMLERGKRNPSLINLLRLAAGLETDVGDPAYLLLDYISSTFGFSEICGALATSTGALATSESGKKRLEINGIGVAKSKSDLVVKLDFPGEATKTVGVSMKPKIPRTKSR